MSRQEKLNKSVNCHAINKSHRPLSLGGHVGSQENKKLCFCTASLAQIRIQCEASRATTKPFILQRLNMAAE